MKCYEIYYLNINQSDVHKKYHKGTKKKDKQKQRYQKDGNDRKNGEKKRNIKDDIDIFAKYILSAQQIWQYSIRYCIYGKFEGLRVYQYLIKYRVIIFSMTILNYTVTCQCSKQRKGSFSHNDSSKDIDDLRCDHFLINMNQTTRASSFFEFGSKNMCRLTLNIRCLNCGKKAEKEHEYWGWTVGDAKDNTHSCCGKTVTFKSHES